MASSYRSYTVEYSWIIIRQQCGGLIHAVWLRLTRVMVCMQAAPQV